MKVILNDVRIAFCESIFTPKAFAGEGAPRYGAKFPIAPGSEHHKAIEAAIEAVAKDAFKDKAKAVLAQLRKDGKVFYTHEDYTNKDGEVYDGFGGMYCLSAGQSEDKGRPLVVDRTGVRSDSEKDPERSYTQPNSKGVMFPILSARDGKPYGGCYVNVTLDVWVQDNKFGRRINCQLKGVQYLREGDAFGGGAPASVDDFADDLGVEEEEDSLAG